MALLAQSYPVICEIRKTRKLVLGAIDCYYGYPLMRDDDDTPAGSLIAPVGGDASDRFGGVALESVMNASDAQGAAGDVYVNVMVEGSYIAELSGAPTLADLGKAVYAHATDTALVTVTETNACAIGVIEEYINVGDPLARANAVRVRIPAPSESVVAGA